MCLGVTSVKFSANEILNLLSVANERARVVIDDNLRQFEQKSYLSIFVHRFSCFFPFDR